MQPALTVGGPLLSPSSGTSGVSAGMTADIAVVKASIVGVELVRMVEDEQFAISLCRKLRGEECELVGEGRWWQKRIFIWCASVLSYTVSMPQVCGRNERVPSRYLGLV